MFYRCFFTYLYVKQHLGTLQIIVPQESDLNLVKVSLGAQQVNKINLSGEAIRCLKVKDRSSTAADDRRKPLIKLPKTYICLTYLAIFSLFFLKVTVILCQFISFSFFSLAV